MGRKKVYNEDKIIELIKTGKKYQDISNEIGCSLVTVKKVGQKIKNATHFTAEEKSEEYETAYKWQKTLVSSMLLNQNSNPVILNAIYRIPCWQKLFLDKDSVYSLDTKNDNEKKIFDFFKWVYNKNNKTMPNQDGITTRWNNLWERKKAEGLGLDEDKFEEIDDLFTRIIWNIDETEEFLNEEVKDYLFRYKSHDILSYILLHLNEQGSFDKCNEYLSRLNKVLNISSADIKSLSEVSRQDKIPYYPFFIEEIQKRIQGLPVGLNTLFGLTGSGKTMAVVNQLVHLALNGISSIHCILGDITEDEFLCRTLSHIDTIDPNGGKHTFREIFGNDVLRETLMNKYNKILDMIYVVELTNGQTTSEIISMIDKKRKETAEAHQQIPCFISIDYDDLITSKTNLDNYDNWVKEVYHPFQLYGTSNRVSILMLAQPTKKAQSEVGDKEERILGQSDMKGGVAKSNESGVTIAFTAKESDKDKKIRPVTVAITKGRYGGKGFYKDVFFDGDHCTYFENLNDLSNDKLETEKWIGDE